MSIASKLEKILDQEIDNTCIIELYLKLYLQISIPLWSPIRRNIWFNIEDELADDTYSTST